MNMVKNKLGHKLYFAYGMNTNHSEMARRCPDAEFIGIGELKGYELKFRGVADVEKSKAGVIGAIWMITQQCEDALDILEGYPYLYRKEYERVIIQADDWVGDNMSECLKTMEMGVMFYKMNNDEYEDMPSNYYWNMLWDGYEKSQIPTEQMESALGATRSVT